MPGTFGAGPLLSPWVGAWELVWQSPESWLVLTSAAIGLTLGGAALTVFSKGQPAQKAAPAVVVARTQPQGRPSRRSRRRAA